ncbi:MAG TPA: PAS domain-containing protein, partial [Candidatus Saccharimonadales bacterium]|nr:PAS domain-containing protein [Candidatus Saccharimonadales bacterium]
MAVAIGLLGYFFPAVKLSSSLFIGPLISMIAGISIVFGLTGYLVKSPRTGYWLVFVSYLSFVAASLVLIVGSGSLDSPYIAMLMLLIILGGMFGWLGLVSSGLIAHGLLGWQLLSQSSLSPTTIGIFILGIELSLVISYFLWHKSHEVDKANTSYSKLVHELGQVAGKSEIVINAIADGVIAMDSRGVIQLINPAAQTMLGWGKQDAAKLDYRSVIKIVDSHNEPLSDQTDPINQGLTTGRVITTSTFSIRTMSDKTFLASIQVSPFGQIGTESGGVIVVFRDITRQKAEEREQAEFISTASHEMRTP